MPIIPDPKCYCTKTREKRSYYGYTPNPIRDYICDLHRSEQDSRMLKIFPEGMRDGIDFTLTFEIGFEDFGAYETWGQGWIAKGIVKGKTVTVVHRYGMQALDLWLKKAESIMNEST